MEGTSKSNMVLLFFTSFKSVSLFKLYLFTVTFLCFYLSMFCCLVF